MSRFGRFLLVSVLAMFVPFASQVALAADTGVQSKKLILLNKAMAGDPGPVKFVFVAGPDAGIQKGPAGDPLLFAAELTWAYELESGGSVAGAFDTPLGSPRWVNNETVAKYKNPDPCGETCLKSIVVKVGKLFKAASRIDLSDEVLTGDLFLGPPTAAAGIVVAATIENGIDSSTHRMCTRFATDLGSTVLYKEVAGGLGIKLVAKRGVPTTCP